MELSVIFIGFVALQVGLKLWLAQRQMRHVAQHRSVVPPEFAAQIDLAAHQKAADYTMAKVRLGGYELALSTLLLLVWTLLGGLDYLWQLTASMSSTPLLQGVYLIVGFSVLNALIDLPFSYHRQFGLEAAFGFNRMTLRLWLLDLFKGTLFATLLGLPLIAFVLWLLQISGGLWWLWTWLTLCLFNGVLLWAYPTWIAPWFNRFEPLNDQLLAERIDALVTRCGFGRAGLFVMDGSRRSSHGNAYFTGMGANKRIVFFDTLLTQLSPPQIEAVLAHELGHFKHRHIRKRIISSFGFSFVLLALCAYLLQQPWFYSGLGASIGAGQLSQGQTPYALGLLLFMLIAPVFGFIVQPLMSALSRRDEFQADRFAREHANGDDLTSALVTLYKDNAATLTPDPWYSRFYDSHPPASVRIAALQQG